MRGGRERAESKDSRPPAALHARSLPATRRCLRSNRDATQQRGCNGAASRGLCEKLTRQGGQTRWSGTVELGELRTRTLNVGQSVYVHVAGSRVDERTRTKVKATISGGSAADPRQASPRGPTRRQARLAGVLPSRRGYGVHGEGGGGERRRGREGGSRVMRDGNCEAMQPGGGTEYGRERRRAATPVGQTSVRRACRQTWPLRKMEAPPPPRAPPHAYPRQMVK